MVIVPNRLLKESFVETIHQGRNLVVLGKQLDQAMDQRASYVSMHALSWIRKGAQVLETPDDTTKRVGHGNWVFVKRGIYTISDLLPKKGTFQSLHVFFSDDFIRWALELLHFQGQPQIMSPFYHGRCSEPIQNQFLRIEQERFSDVSMKLEVLRLLLLIVQEGFPPEQLAGLSEQPTSDLLGFMQQNFAKPFTIDDYAYLSGRSTSTFRREFRVKIGTSPQQWIIQKRMEKAKDLIGNGDLSVSQLAAQVGYDNVSHFIGVFKRTFGITPKQATMAGQVSWKEND